MSITSDIRGYADTAIDQGKQVVGQAQTQITEITNTVTHRASGVATDLRTQAEKTLNIDAIKSAVEPYLAQAKQYRASVTDRAEGLFDTVKGDKRVAKVVATAESVTGVVVDTVTERVVKPVTSLTGRSKTRKPAAKKSTAKKAPAKKAGAKKAASTRPAAKKASTAKKSAAKKTTSASS